MEDVDHGRRSLLPMDPRQRLVDELAGRASLDPVVHAEEVGPRGPVVGLLALLGAKGDGVGGAVRRELERIIFESQRSI